MLQGLRHTGRLGPELPDIFARQAFSRPGVPKESTPPDHSRSSCGKLGHPTRIFALGIGSGISVQYGFTGARALNATVPCKVRHQHSKVTGPPANTLPVLHKPLPVQNRQICLGRISGIWRMSSSRVWINRKHLQLTLSIIRINYKIFKKIRPKTHHPLQRKYILLLINLH